MRRVLRFGVGEGESGSRGSGRRGCRGRCRGWERAGRHADGKRAEFMQSTQSGFTPLPHILQSTKAKAHVKCLQTIFRTQQTMQHKSIPKVR